MGKTIAPYGMGNRGVQPLPRLWVHATMPTLTIESGFMSNAKDSALLAQPSFREALAQGVANGILAYAPQIPKLHAEELAYRTALVKLEAARRVAASRAHLGSRILGWALVVALTALLLFLALYRDTLGRALRFLYGGFRSRAPSAARAAFFGFQRAVTPREQRVRPPARRRPTSAVHRAPARTSGVRSGRGSKSMRREWRVEGPATRPQRVAEMVHPDERHRMLRGHRSIYDDLSL
jgi:hypothetical protein